MKSGHLKDHLEWQIFQASPLQTPKELSSPNPPPLSPSTAPDLCIRSISKEWPPAKWSWEHTSHGLCLWDQPACVPCLEQPSEVGACAWAAASSFPAYFSEFHLFFHVFVSNRKKTDNLIHMKALIINSVISFPSQFNICIEKGFLWFNIKW